MSRTHGGRRRADDRYRCIVSTAATSRCLRLRRERAAVQVRSQQSTKLAAQSSDRTRRRAVGRAQSRVAARLPGSRAYMRSLVRSGSNLMRHQQSLARQAPPWLQSLARSRGARRRRSRPLPQQQRPRTLICLDSTSSRFESCLRVSHCRVRSRQAELRAATAARGRAS